MKKLALITISCFLAGVLISFSGGAQYETLKIGSKAPMTDIVLQNSVGEKMNLEEAKGDNGTLVIFSCNTCPFVIAWEDRYPELASLSKKNDIGFVLLNSNAAKRQGDDSVEAMEQHAKEKGYANVPYLVDENSKVANAFGAKTTPHVFLFDAEWKLVYEGAIDDNYKSKNDVSAYYLNDAIKNLAAGNNIDPNNTKAMGCSIKRIKVD